MCKASPWGTLIVATKKTSEKRGQFTHGLDRICRTQTDGLVLIYVEPTHDGTKLMTMSCVHFDNDDGALPAAAKPLQCASALWCPLPRSRKPLVSSHHVIAIFKIDDGSNVWQTRGDDDGSDSDIVAALMAMMMTGSNDGECLLCECWSSLGGGGGSCHRRGIGCRRRRSWGQCDEATIATTAAKEAAAKTVDDTTINQYVGISCILFMEAKLQQFFLVQP